MTVPLDIRLLEKVAHYSTTGCWIFTGAKAGSDNKYGHIRLGQSWRGYDYAHRVSYRLFVGPIPPGKEIDHICRTPRCVRPSHLRAVTHSENLHASPFTFASQLSARVMCNYGHNDWIVCGQGKYRCRVCRTCRRARDRARRPRKRG